jgi:hypothetical protein
MTKETTKNCPAMRCIIILIAAALAAASATAATVPVQWLTATVISQNVETVQTGSRTTQSIWGGTVNRAMTGRINTVEVEDDQYRTKWVEQIGFRDVVAILTVGQKCHYFMDRGQFVVLDANGRKHRFNLAGKSLVAGAPVSAPAAETDAQAQK